MGAIAVSSAAMIVLFSVFNGLEGTVKDMYSAFYPDVKISAAKGKFFTIDEQERVRLAGIKGLDKMSYTLEDLVLLYANDEQKVATLKGVDDNWFQVSNLDSYMFEGNTRWQAHGETTPAIVGMGLAAALGIDVNNDFSGLKVYRPKQGTGAELATDPASAINSLVVKPHGTFIMQDEISGHYVIVPLAAARHLLETGDQVSYIEIKLLPQAKEAAVVKQIKTILGDSVTVEGRFEQNKTFYMIMRSEKWAVYAILLMVLLIASFNMIGSLSMLVMEKRKDIAILRSMGATAGSIRWLFLCLGVLLSLSGGALGILIGASLCMGQQLFGWISLPNGFIIDAYPVHMQWADFGLVFVTVCAVGLLAAWFPARKAMKQAVVVREE